MSLENTIASGVSAAFKAIGDLNKSGTIVEVSSTSSYDPINDKTTRKSTNHNCDSTLSRYSQEEVDNSDIVPTDLKALVPAASIVSGHVPTTNDDFIDSKGTRYTIENVGGVPSDSLWILQLRKI